MMTVDEMIAVLTHYKNGGKVQCKNKANLCWLDFIECQPRWDFIQFDYRAKPEPLTIWVELDKNGTAVNLCKDELKKAQYGGTIKKLVEVEQ